MNVPIINGPLEQTVHQKSEPLVSVFVSVYNSERFLCGALEELEGQTIVDKLEIIIIETGSPANEIEIVREFQKKYNNIIYLRTGDREYPPAAVNRGIKVASGKFFTIANSDDRYRPDAFEIMVGELLKNPEAGLVYGDIFVTSYANQTFQRFIRCGYSIRPEYSKEIMLSGCHIGPQPMWRREVHEEFGLFDESLETAADYEFWCRIAQKYSFKYIPKFLGVYFHNPQGMVNSNKDKGLEQTQLVKRIYQDKFPPPQKDFVKRLHYLKNVPANRYVNIGMVTFNRLEFTKSSIASLLEFTCFPHVITVVDNGSTDGTGEYLQGLKKEGIITNLILLKENVGIAKASNLAWSQEPNAEYYVKFDNDIVIQKPNWLERMVGIIDAASDLAMVGYNFEPKSYPIQIINGLKVRPKTGNLGGACVLIPKRTEQLLGYWCEDYGLYGEEDADYGIRLTLSGLMHAYMEDEQVGVHLPAGRAAHIDPRTSLAEDGIEERQYADYRKFKDNLRHINVEGRAKENFELYQRGQKSLYCQSTFLETFQSEELEPSPLSVPTRQSTKPFLEKEDCQSSSQSARRVSVIANDSFCGGLRLYYPLDWLRQNNELAGQMLSEGDIWKSTVDLPVGKQEAIVVQRIANLIEPMLEAAKSRGTRIIHDFDDLLWKIPQDNNNSQVITRPMLECFFRIMAQSDCVTVSTEPLRQALVAWGIEATLLPNCLFPEHWSSLNPRRRTGSRPRVGFVGQAGVHREDVAILLPVIEMLGQEVEWVFLGEIPEVQPGVRFEAETHSMVPLQDFPAKLANLNLDLALAPLALNEFNEAKSDLRILQYGILGYPVVATDIFPYQIACVTGVPNDSQSWARAIREHINNPDSSEVQGAQLREWVLSHRMFEQWASHYKTAWLGGNAKAEMISESKNIHQASHSVSRNLSDRDRASYDCSIIIPVFNKVELTRQCLSHLAEVTHGCSYEVIVVDNASIDGTGKFLASLEGDIQVITNDSNRGFAKACNQGATKARGKHLVFLNNDTIPKVGWLSALVNEVEQHADVAIVGSKLLYPNETIQHAGVVFSKKCLTPYHIFNSVPSDFIAANIRQEFQAVTAACLLIRKEVFHSVGGFDEEYLNGFEDVDLCLKVRESGEKVIYQPQSVLYHLEEQTPGRKNPETERQNGRLLMDRWGDKIVVDEDYYVVSAGYSNRYSSENGKLGLKLEPFKNEVEKYQWEHAKIVQENLLKRRYGPKQQQYEQIDSAIRMQLSDASTWPDEKDTLHWAAGVCKVLEMVENECGFWKQVLSLGENTEARGALAKQALKDGNLPEASQHVKAILAMNSIDGLGLWLQGILSIQSLDYMKAVDSFQQALTNGYDPPKSGLGLGMSWMGAGEAEKAWEAFQNVIRSNPDNLEAVNGLIQSGTTLQWWEKLLSHLTRYLDRNPANGDIRFALAGVCYRAGEIVEAHKHYETLQLFHPEYDGLKDLGECLKEDPKNSHVQTQAQSDQSTLYEHKHVQSYFQPPSGNTETYIRAVPIAVVDHSVAVHQALNDYAISGFGTGIDAVEEILPIVFQRQFSQSIKRSYDMWDRVVALTVNCKLVHGLTGQSFSSLQPRDLEDIDQRFAQQEGETRKKEIVAHLNKLRTGETLGMPLYISGTILQYLGAPAEKGAMYMLDGARRLSASALHHEEHVPVILLVFEEEFSQLLQDPVKKELQDSIQHLIWFQNYHSFPFLNITGQRSSQRFSLIDTALFKDSIIIDFGCNLGQASLKAIQNGAKEVWGIEGMPDTIAVAKQIKKVAGCKNLHYLHVDFNDPNFDQTINQSIPGLCDYSFFFSVYRTKELMQRDRLFRYILGKTTKGIFFEGHAHQKIDTIEYYEWLFESFNVPSTFLGYSENQIRPLFFLNLEDRNLLQNSWVSESNITLNPREISTRTSQQENFVKSR